MKISVEFAHALLGSVNWADVQRSCGVAQSIIEYVSAQGHQVTTSVLIDDKHVNPAVREIASEGFLSDLPGPRVSYYCFERDLTDYADDLVDLLEGRCKRRTAADIRRYKAKYHSLPCSVDIAIWHLLRLGVLPDHKNHIRWLNGQKEHAATNLVVSVLGDQSTEYEVAARQNILDHVVDTDAAARIYNIYYPEAFPPESSPVNADALIPSELKEVLHAENPSH